MATLGKQPDAVMMAWYRAKKFGVVRPPSDPAPPSDTVVGSILQQTGARRPPATA